MKMNLKELSRVLDEIPNENVDKLEKLIGSVQEVFLIGNGGSNGIASHMAVDYVKFLHKRCYVPTATDMMSMIVNDYGSLEMYSQFVKYYYSSDIKQLAILISSSGNSMNVVNVAHTCIELEIPMIILSGFDELNPLNQIKSDLVKLRYWVNSKSYGVVEMAHHSFLHVIV